MKMKKNIKMLTCAALSAILVNTNLSVFAKEEEQTSKDETIYAILESDGSVKEEIVSSWLHNDQGLKNVKEKLDIDNVKNVKNDEQPEIKDDVYTWNSDTNDIYYEGTTQKKLPINVKVSYSLDGKEYQGEELIGKSGKLKIHIVMESTQSKKVMIQGKETMIHPFYAGAGLITFSTDHFTNIQTTQGKLISEGNHEIVGFVGIPGFSDTLKSSGLDADVLGLSDDITINCEVKDFEMGPIMIAFTPEIPLDTIEDSSSLSELTEGIAQLQNASSQLLDGTGALATSMETFRQKINEVSSGTSEVKKGCNALVEATGSLDQFVNGLHELKDGSNTLAQQLQVGSDTLNKKLNMQLIEGLKKSLSSAPLLVQDLQELDSALTTLDTHTQAQLQTLMEKVQAIRSNTCPLVNGAPQPIDAAHSNDCVAAATLEEVLVNMQTLTPDQEAVKTAGENLRTDAATLQPLLEMKDSLTTMVEELTTMQSQLSQAADGAEMLANGLTELDSNADALLALNPSLKKLNEAMGQLDTGSHQLYEASGILSAKTNELNKGMQEFKEQGIDEMSEKVSLTIAEVDRLKDIKNELVAEAKQTHSFTGAPENSDTKVKFIYKTKELKKDK